MTPRLVTSVDSGILITFRWIELQVALINCWRIPGILNCVLSAFSFSRIDVIELFIPIHDVSSNACFSEISCPRMKTADNVFCVSSAHERASIPCRWRYRGRRRCKGETEPAPVDFLAGLYKSLSTCWIAVLHRRLVKDVVHDLTTSWMPNIRCWRSSRMPWSTVSDASDRSSKTRTAISPQSDARYA